MYFVMTEDDEENSDPLVPATEDIAESPNDIADPDSIVRGKIAADILLKYEVYSYRNAAVILSETRKAEFDEILSALRDFRITSTQIRKPGGNESDIPKLISASLRPLGWHETVVQGDLVVKLRWREQNGVRRGKPIFEPRIRERTREKYLDGHKIDYVKGRVAFDLEWNSKDQTFDRDLYAFSAFHLCGVIDVAILLTRSAQLDPVFRSLGPALDRNGNPSSSPTHVKYGASTTWMGKLLYRLNAGRNGGCPVLALGIRPACITDWSP